MEPKYKEPAVKTPTAAQLTEIASQLGFDLGPAEIQEYKGMDCQFLTKWIHNQATEAEVRLSSVK